jgi:lipopolysaccharide transport system permease protein
MESEKEHWDIIIKPQTKKFSLNLNEVWKYRDLIRMYIRRDIVTMYKQTILGPLWYIIQPIFTTIMYMFVFGGIAGISTDGIPQPVFYLSGIMLWNYFGECLGRSSSTFGGNAGVFSKVYFPRLVVPISGLISGLVKLAIQVSLFLIVYFYYIQKGVDIHPNGYLLFLFPLLIIISAIMGFGIGIIISSMTTKYRDLAFFFGFITYLWMYATPIIYPLSAIPEKVSDYKWIVEYNPMTPIIETTRYIFTGMGQFSWSGICYSSIIAIGISIIGIWLFNKIERKFIDVV